MGRGLQSPLGDPESNREDFLCKRDSMGECQNCSKVADVRVYVGHSILGCFQHIKNVMIFQKNKKIIYFKKKKNEITPSTGIIMFFQVIFL